MSIEAGAVIDMEGKAFHWHLPEGRSGGSLPDSQSLWDVLWENRKRVYGFAHSHPGSGIPGPSLTDITTFAAIEAALGKRLNWWICTSDEFALFRWRGSERLDYIMVMHVSPILGGTSSTPAWLDELRRLSNYEKGD
jgi:hypothetical protein